MLFRSGDSVEKKKIHWVRWDGLSLPKSLGDLGCKRLKAMNEALLGKWLWRFGVERDHLWRMVIAEKYGEEEGGWISKDPQCPFGITLWKSIMRGKENFYKGVRFSPGDGNRISFWHDLCLGEKTLCETYPEIYANAIEKNAKIGEMFSRNVGGGTWNIIFEREVNDWEEDRYLEFYGKIYEAGVATPNNYPRPPVSGSSAP